MSASTLVAPALSLSDLSVLAPTIPVTQIQVPLCPSKANNCKKSTLEDPITDEIDRKRQKQNEAAKKSRDKKLVQLQVYKQQVEELEREKFELAVKVACLENERLSWQRKEAEMQMTIDSLRSNIFN